MSVQHNLITQEECDRHLGAAIEEASKRASLLAHDGGLLDRPYVDEFLARLIERMARRDGKREQAR